jgi:hypothetical protein
MDKFFLKITNSKRERKVEWGIILVFLLRIVSFLKEIWALSSET